MSHVSKARQTHSKSSSTSFISSLLLSLMLSFLVTVVMNCVDWQWRGYEGINQQINQSYDYHIKQLTKRQHEFATSYVAISEAIQKRLSRLIEYIKQRIASITPWHLRKATSKETAVLTKIIGVWGRLSSILLDTAKVIILKIVSVICSFWIFTFASLLGALDGLVSRYVRTKEGGRESAFAFHTISSMVIKVPSLIMAVYLIMPVMLDPQWIVCLLSLVFFSYFRILTSQLKKYG